MGNIGRARAKLLWGVVVFVLLLFSPSVIRGELQADINGDGVVDFYDFAVLADEWLQERITPQPTFQITFPSLGVVRDSIAYDADFRKLPPNVGRHEHICVASRPIVWVNQQTGKLVQAIDGDLIICSDGENWVLLYTTTDGVNFTKLADISKDGYFVGYYESNDNIRSVKVMADGSWLLSFGRLNLGGTGDSGHLFRSVDKGLTWTHVLVLERGYAPYWGWCAVSDNEIAVGEYGFIYQANNPRRIYYSNDYGATWSKIWEPPAELGQHCHVVAFKPGDTNVLYASYDGYPVTAFATGRAKVIKLQYTPGEGGKRNPSNWSETANSPVLPQDNPVYALSDGRYLYLGHDSTRSPVLWRLDPADDSVISVLDWMRPFNDSNNPYVMGDSSGAQVFGMILHEGVYYAAVRSKVDGIGGGIYVSKDGKHWTCAYRVEGVEGFHNIVGFANGYLWGTYYDTIQRLYKMSLVRAEAVRAMRVERGVTNQFNTMETSSFEGGNGGWRIRSPSEDVNATLTGVSTEQSLHGISSYRIVCENKGNGVGCLYSGYCPVDPNPGEYICASFWIKGASSWPDEFKCSARLSGAGGVLDTLTGDFRLTPTQQGWERKTVWGKCIEDGFTYGLCLDLKFYGSDYNGDFANATCYVDCVQMAYFNDLHYSGPWQIGGTPRANEVATGSLVGLGPEFTTTFEWQPELSRRQWHGNIYIANWTDGQEHIDLYYDNANSKFVATDGNNTAATTQELNWDYPDNIKLAFTNMDGDFRLSVQTPLNGVEHILTDNSNTRLGSPVAITFGTDSCGTNYGCGLIANIKHFNSSLSTSEIEDIFDMSDALR